MPAHQRSGTTGLLTRIWLRHPSLESNITLIVTTLGIYLGIVYVFSFSQAADTPRHAAHSAILLLDGLIAARVFRQRVSARNAAGRAFRVAAYVTLIWVVLLQIDYVLARYRGAEDGLTGPLLRLKSYLIGAQVACVFFLALSHASPFIRQRIAGFLRFGAEDLLLPAIVLVPLANYLVRNREIFSLLSAIEYLGFFLLCAIVFLMLVRFLERLLAADPLSVPVVAGLAFVYYSMPQVSSLVRRPIEALFMAHIALALAVSAVLAAMYFVNRRSTARWVALVAGCSTVISMLQPGQAETGAFPPPSNRASLPRESVRDSGLDRLLAARAKRRPDVFLLVYDGYAPSAMMKRYGIDDGAIAGYLRSRGFATYERAYSLFMSSRPSMASLLDMRLVPRAPIGGSTTAGRFFSEQGYRTHLVLNSYLLHGSDSFAADVVFPRWHYRSGLGALYRGIGGGEFKTEVVFEDSDRAEWLSAKRSVLAADGPPKMLYAHSGFPGHSQNSGSCVPDETLRYAARLAVANEEMKSDIETILTARRDAIIIVAGDHGPFLTGDCLYMARHTPDELSPTHLADRYGAKLAIRWPEERLVADRIETIQDVFFAVAAYLLVDDRVWLHRLPAETVGYGGIPDGAVRDGIVQVGDGGGKPLF